MAKSLGPLTSELVVERALRSQHRGTKYKLGAGGRNPFAQSPGDPCDCSGFAAWCVGVDRFLSNAGVPHLEGRPWFETSSLFEDARSPYGFVAEVPWTQARPGDLLVFGDKGGRQGHVGVVTAANHTGPTAVAHCSVGNEKRLGDAIAETGVDVFKRNAAVVARVSWVVYP